MHLFELVDVNREILQWLEKIWTIHLNKSNCIKIEGTNVKILIGTKLVGVIPKLAGPVLKLVGSYQYFYYFIIFS
jgi:hypothetical protein